MTRMARPGWSVARSDAVVSSGGVTVCPIGDHFFSAWHSSTSRLRRL